jgi:type II secretory pathway component GspD/PulD (secretin)
MRKHFWLKAGVLAMIALFFFAVDVYPKTDASQAYSKTDTPALDDPTRKNISEYPFPGLKKKISLDVREMDMAQFLKFLATEGNLNIITSKAVTGPVSLLINDVTIGDALELALAMNGFAYQVKGNVITVMTTAESKTMFGVEFYDQRQTAIYQLKYASPKNVAAILGNIKSDIGKIVFDDTTGTLVLIDTPSKVKEMDVIIQKQELPTVSRVLPTDVRLYELRYAKVETVKDEVSKLLTPDIGSIRTDLRTNTLVVTDLPHVLEKLDVLINAFDRKVREVFIDAKIIEVTLNDKFQWGVDWSKVITIAGKFSALTLMPQASFPLALDSVTGMGKMTVSTTSTNNKLEVVMEALDTLAETRILSNPHITVEEGKEAKVEVIEKQPYEEETTTTATGGTTTNAKTYQWVDIGVSLSVTPHINQDGYISMVIKPVMSSISAWYGGVPQAAGSVPVVKSANAQTTVTIKDGVTIIIAGLVKENKTKNEGKIPVLGNIPWLGMAFKRITDEVSRTETIVFLTPRVVSGEESFPLEKDRPKPVKGLKA